MHKNSYTWGAKSKHVNPDGSSYPAIIGVKLGASALTEALGAGAGLAGEGITGAEADGGVKGIFGFDLTMVATGKGILTSSYRSVLGYTNKMTVVIVMRDEKTKAEVLRLNRYLDRIV